MLPDRFCAICFSQGREGRLITNPYCGECRHAYCYSCLVGEVVGEEGDGWACLRCGKMIQHVKRWEELVEEEGIAVEQEVHANNDRVEDEPEETSQSESRTPEDEDEVEVEAESDEGENLFTRR
jgi:peroxin-2